MNDNNDKVEKSVKVVLTGEAGVGKTSIIYRFVKEAFDPNLMSTNRATFSSKQNYVLKYGIQLARKDIVH